MVYNLCLFTVVVIIDGTTIAHLRKHHKECFLRNGEVASANTRERKETLLFIQAFSNSCVYISMLLCFHLISQLVTPRWTFLYFLCTTFAWEMSHTLGG
ncbi:hypothetical protein Y032_0217g2398 [Ancylostoma ceylanicum]|nr:hypothetical protein Y032_0217g2398 [Ancylostoma ceylanicum]